LDEPDDLDHALAGRVILRGGVAADDEAVDTTLDPRWSERDPSGARGGVVAGLAEVEDFASSIAENQGDRIEAHITP
jgi:hypothetical protein